MAVGRKDGGGDEEKPDFWLALEDAAAPARISRMKAQLRVKRHGAGISVCVREWVQDGDRDAEIRTIMRVLEAQHIVGNDWLPVSDGATLDFAPSFWDQEADTYTTYAGRFKYSIACSQILSAPESSSDDDEDDDDDEDEDDEGMAAATLGATAMEEEGYVTGLGDDAPHVVDLVCSLKFAVPDAKVGHLVGARGAHINGIRAAHQCSVEIADQGMRHPAAVDIAGRAVLVVGAPAQVAGAVRACYEMVTRREEGFGDHTLVRLLVPQLCAKQVAAVLGAPVPTGPWDETAVVCTLGRFQAQHAAVLDVLGPSPSQYRRDVHGREVTFFAPLTQPGPGAGLASSAPARSGQRHAHNKGAAAGHLAIKAQRKAIKKDLKKLKKTKKGAKVKKS